VINENDMTKFIKSEFSAGEIATYNGRFVARFKRGGRGPFLTFLVKNFTVEEYFAQLEAGMAPLKILESKGYLTPTVVRLLKSAGYSQTVAGMRQYIEDKITSRQSLAA
jgi:hypothetical protein